MVVSPAGTGTVHVTVTTPNGTSATSTSDEYTYNRPADGHQSTRPTGPQAGGTTVTVTGTGFVTGATRRLRHRLAGTAVSVSAATSPHGHRLRRGPARSHVTVITPSGTSATSTSDKYTYNAPPTVTNVNPTNGPQAGAPRSRSPAPASTRARPRPYFGSTPGTGVSVSPATALTVNAPAGTGTVS